MIENMLHKHRYFGHSGAIHESCPWVVTTVSPMKRGLKAGVRDRERGSPTGYNRFPDEKGTERRYFEKWQARMRRVTTVSPMKRGLKVLMACP